jgi:hypothetical protein
VNAHEVNWAPNEPPPRRHAFTRARSTKLGRCRRAAPHSPPPREPDQQPDMRHLHGGEYVQQHSVKLRVPRQRGN